MKNINIPLMVINWCAIKAKEEDINEIIIKNSLLFKNLQLCIIFLIVIIIRTKEKKWINLKRKITLLNSNGKRNSSLLSPIDRGNKIYCSINDMSEIFAVNRVIKKIEMKIIDPNITKIIFLMLKLKKKQIIDKREIIMKKCPVGVCFVKNDIPMIIGKENQ